MADEELNALKAAVRPARKTKPAAKAAASKAAPTPKHEAADLDANPRASRPTRAAQTRRQRRMRDPSNLADARKHLTVDPDMQEDAERRGVTLRWVHDKGIRTSQMFRRDWDPVEKDGKPVKRPASNSEEVDMVLMEKPTEWVEEERLHAAQRRSEELTNRIKNNASADPNVGYVRGNNDITRNNG